MLTARVAELEAKLGKKPTNSSKPPSTTHPHDKLHAAQAQIGTQTRRPTRGMTNMNALQIPESRGVSRSRTVCADRMPITLRAMN